jgi:hypothetical protein
MLKTGGTDVTTTVVDTVLVVHGHIGVQNVVGILLMVVIVQILFPRY